MGSRSRILDLIFILFVAAVVLSRARAQSDCNDVLANLSPCLDYITGNSSNPSPGCCNQLANVIKAQASCLCEVVNGNVPPIGVRVNQTRALALPEVCNLQTPSISQCNVTVPSPSGAPKGSSGGSPGTPPGGGNSSDGYRIKMSLVDDGFSSILTILLASSYFLISAGIV